MPHKTKVIYLINSEDCVFENDTLIRLKRKYGKFKRPVFKFKLKRDESNKKCFNQ